MYFQVTVKEMIMGINEAFSFITDINNFLVVLFLYALIMGILFLIKTMIIDNIKISLMDSTKKEKIKANGVPLDETSLSGDDWRLKTINKIIAVYINAGTVFFALIIFAAVVKTVLD